MNNEELEKAEIRNELSLTSDGQDGGVSIPFSEAQSANDASSSANAYVQSGSEARQTPTANSNEADQAAVAAMRRKTRRSFIVGGVSALASIGGWRWLRTRREDDELAWPLRLSHEFNEQLSRDYFSRTRLAPTFAAEMATEPRENGSFGLDEEDFDPAEWRLALVGLANPPETVTVTSSGSPADSNSSFSKKSAEQFGRANKNDEVESASNVANDSESDDESDGADSETDSADNTAESEADLLLTLAEIKQLPQVEMVTQLKCIEGWSVIVRWAGVRLADLIAKYPPLTSSGEPPDLVRRPADLVGYVGLETPDGEYYVGLDMESALHPQTLLCYEMNGQPLSPKHGAPLRLVIPVKYGIKNIKRIGKITYSDKRPADYWAERGYDWYSGH